MFLANVFATKQYPMGTGLRAALEGEGLTCTRRNYEHGPHVHAKARDITAAIAKVLSRR